MKKNKYIILILLLIYFAKVDMVIAETNVCEYADDEITITFNEGGTADVKHNFYEQKKIPYILNSIYNYNSGSISTTDQLELQEKEYFGECPSKLYVCKYEETSWNSGLSNIFSEEKGMINVLNKVYIFYSEGEMNQNSNLKGLKNDEVIKGSQFIDSWEEGYNACSGYDLWFLDEITGWVCSNANAIIIQPVIGAATSYENFYIKYKNCFISEYTGDNPTYNLACPNLSTYFDRFNNAIDEYKACSNNDAVCISETITDINKKEMAIKNYCKSILQEQDYDGGTEQDCIEECFDVGSKTIKVKKDAGILSENSGDCGVSHRLIVWLTNIFRWVKYILPVVVIVLGILDFIKAIGADKDDEIKKAQGKFIRRLIAAALVFIVPLILEFVLTKMGFGYDSCSLF